MAHPDPQTVSPKETADALDEGEEFDQLEVCGEFANDMPLLFICV